MNPARLFISWQHESSGKVCGYYNPDWQRDAILPIRCCRILPAPIFRVQAVHEASTAIFDGESAEGLVSIFMNDSNLLIALRLCSGVGCTYLIVI